MGKESLRDVTPAEFESTKAKLTSEEMQRRVRHVVTEIQRCEEAADALKKDDLVTFGKLMRASHDSLRSV